MTDYKRYDTMAADYLSAQQNIQTSAQHQSREIITHYQTSTVAVRIPLIQCAITAVLLAILVMIASYALSWPWLKIGGISFAAIMALDWIRRSEGWRRRVDDLEYLLHVDLNQDGLIASQPEPVRTETVKLEVTSEGGKRTQFVDLPVSRAKIAEFASGLCYGQAFSENAWSGAGALFSRREFREVRDTMIDRNWVTWKNPEHPKQGLTLTSQGGAVMKFLAAEHRRVKVDQVEAPAPLEANV